MPYKISIHSGKYKSEHKKWIEQLRRRIPINEIARQYVFSAPGGPNVQSIAYYLKVLKRKCTEQGLLDQVQEREDPPMLASESWEETTESASFDYKGTERIDTIEKAIAKSGADLDLWIPGQFRFTASEVTMKLKVKVGENEKGKPIYEQRPSKHINYHSQVSFERKHPPAITEQRRREIAASIGEHFIHHPAIPGTYEMHLILPCVHRPFHNQYLWGGVLQLIHELGDRLSGITITGDYLDLLSLSIHDREKISLPGIDLGVEYESGYEGLQELKQAAGKQWNEIRKVYIYGNHEDRYLRRIRTIEASKLGSALISPEKALDLAGMGFELLTNWKDDYLLLGNDLEIFHGVYFTDNAAKTHLQALNSRSCVFGHTHRICSYTQGAYTAYNIGWLGDNDHPAFAYRDRFGRGKWCNGFAVVYLDEQGRHYLDVIRCSEQGFFFGGKFY